ncbi:YolD-like family protein [Ornithinibacillus halophilus]|uniref:YolD-like protein n=1 Tax=Ornithinibacillus halophilus TaxID=930117 RepID=A0A1M5CK95_9BACI|nr:YolD-like family protein [Ornithinibacillus halophilus]SHF55195.1 YolD-like protein [Ornithinibacillus halophilus]
MVHDRGSIKWTSLMLPEHVALLEEMWHTDKKISKPILDEQEIEMINQELMQAYTQKEEIRLTVYHKGSLIQYVGIIEKVLPTQSKIVLKVSRDETIPVLLSNIIKTG